MLFNPNWKKEAKPDVHSLESLIQWLEGKEPSQEYHYYSARSCLLSQYYRDKGYKAVMVTPTRLYHGIGNSTRLPYVFNDIAMYGKSTFGAALQRARVAQKQLHAA